MKIINPQYSLNLVTGENACINFTNEKGDRVSVSISESNADYQEIMRQVNEEGLVIQPYE